MIDLLNEQINEKELRRMVKLCRQLSIKEPERARRVFDGIEFLRIEGFRLMELYPDHELLHRNVSLIGLAAMECLFEVHLINQKGRL